MALNPFVSAALGEQDPQTRAWFARACFEFELALTPSGRELIDGRKFTEGMNFSEGMNFTEGIKIHSRIDWERLHVQKLA
jgi:hypothetical protein